MSIHLSDPILISFLHLIIRKNVKKYFQASARNLWQYKIYLWNKMDCAMYISHYSHSLSDSLKVRIKLLLLNWNRTEIKVDSVALSRRQWLAYNKLLQKNKNHRKEVFSLNFCWMFEWMDGGGAKIFTRRRSLLLCYFPMTLKLFVNDRFCKFQSFLLCSVKIFFFCT